MCGLHQLSRFFPGGKFAKPLLNLKLPAYYIVQEDMRAEIGACTVGERRLQTLVAKYGLESFLAHKQRLFDSARRMIFMTGDMLGDGSREFLEGAGNRYLAKPFSIQDLREAVASTLAAALPLMAAGAIALFRSSSSAA